MEEGSSSTNPPVAQQSQADQEASSEPQNIPMETSRPTEPSRGGRTKAQANKGCARGKNAREKSRDAVPGGEDVARPFSRFEVDRY